MRFYLDVIERFPNRVPLFVVADVAGLEPSAHEGVFAHARKSVPVSRRLAFTAQPYHKDWQELKRSEVITEIVPRIGRDAIYDLNKVVRREWGKFTSTPEFLFTQHLTMLIQESRGPSDPHFVLQMARGIVKPQEYFGKIMEFPKQKVPFVGDLIKPDTYLSRLVHKRNLNFWQRAIVKESAWYAFTMLKRSKSGYIEKYAAFFTHPYFPSDQEGWVIFRRVYNKLLGSQRTETTDVDRDDGYGSRNGANRTKAL